jgi:hypothetical protein
MERSLVGLTVSAPELARREGIYKEAVRSGRVLDVSDGCSILTRIN